MGNFNFDSSTGRYADVLDFMKKKLDCVQVINKVTTNNKTQLDLKCTNFTDI